MGSLCGDVSSFFKNYDFAEILVIFKCGDVDFAAT